MSGPLSFIPSAPSLGCLEKSADSICLVKDFEFSFSDEDEGSILQGRRKFYRAQPIQLGEHLLQGPSPNGCSELVASVFASLQQMRAGGIESHHIGALQLVELENEFLLCMKVDMDFVEKMRNLLLRPFLTLKGFIHPGNGPSSRTHPISYEIHFGLSVLNDARLAPIECSLKTRAELTAENGKLSLNGKLSSVTLGWHEPDGGRQIKLSAKSVLHNLPESSKDVTIVVGDGTEFKCHRIIFEAHSPVLAAMISPENGMKEGQTGRIELVENSKRGVMLLLRYFYCVELDTDAMNCAVGLELLKTAHKYELTYLEICLRDWLLRKGKEWYEPDVILELYFFVRNVKDFEKLRDHSVSVMKGMLSEIRFCDRFKELNCEEKENLLWTLLDIKGAD